MAPVTTKQIMSFTLRQLFNYNFYTSIFTKTKNILVLAYEGEIILDICIGLNKLLVIIGH